MRFQEKGSCEKGKLNVHRICMKRQKSFAFASKLQFAWLSVCLLQGFSNYGIAKKLAWQIRKKPFAKLYQKIKIRLTIKLFLGHFKGNTLFQAVSCLQDVRLNYRIVIINQQNTTSYALLRHCNYALTNIDLVAFIPTWGQQEFSKQSSCEFRIKTRNDYTAVSELAFINSCPFAQHICVKRHS